MKANRELGPKETIEDLWKYWYEAILGNDRNSITQQMVRAIWDDVIYKLIIEDRIEKDFTGQSEKHVNRLFLEFLIRNYTDNQVSAIRRELDSTYPLRGPRGVFSLNSLVKDISSRREEITRKKYFELLSLTYEAQDASERVRSLRFVPMNVRGLEQLTRDKDAALTSFMHTYFDKISGASSVSRSPDDLISQNFFDVINTLIDEVKYIGDICNKHIAHAAIPESRKLIESYYSYVSFPEIWKAHKNIFIAMNVLSYLLTGSYLHPLSPPEGDFFTDWDEPLVKPQDIVLLKEDYSRYQNETKSWANPQIFEELLANSSR